MASGSSPLLPRTLTLLMRRVKTSKSWTTGWLAAWTRFLDSINVFVWYLLSCSGATATAGERSFCRGDSRNGRQKWRHCRSKEQVTSMQNVMYKKFWIRFRHTYTTFVLNQRKYRISRYEGELADWKDKYTASLGESAQAKERAELLGLFFLLVWTFLLFWTWQSFLTLYSCSNQNFELGDRLNEKEYRLKVKHPTQPRFGFMFFFRSWIFFQDLDFEFLSFLGAWGSNCHPGRGSCRIPWQDQPSWEQKRQVDKFFWQDKKNENIKK